MSLPFITFVGPRVHTMGIRGENRVGPQGSGVACTLGTSPGWEGSQPLMAVYHHGGVPSLLIHLDTQWMINSHLSPVVAERQTPASVCWAVVS